MAIDLRLYPKALELIIYRYKINTDVAITHFLAQIHHESDGLRRLRESMNYTPDGLRRTFGNRITPAQARNLGRINGRSADQRAIANVVYGGSWGMRNLGNDRPEDGWDYRGAGPLQCTGRRNYAAFQAEIRRLGMDTDIMIHPDALATDVSLGLIHAAYYWKQHIHTLADKAWNVMSGGQLTGKLITQKINGGYNGLSDRYRLYIYYTQKLSTHGYF
ncbi:MAG TPA: hypothetical protein PK047_06965 [Saprospiraceae bacterium]|jgi:putative chitinase|nr:hypothetical protein [Saprospiraceae bacterium]HRP41978.1 hypothetical protein [Saprospiraceae bacterium]